ncbi:MAG: glycosyltransferase family 9 protein [Bacteroidetes bacterium]|nr:glycosyltransferase family 9 protein [Bacteroidota bacterium]MBS1539192.1 glycosyltransferase family 9 protein [Bacteroidota bacterium]
MARPPSFLIIQTAFIGDVILATALIEKIHYHYPDSPIDFLVRKGNEELLQGHPYLRTVLVWNKKQSKIKNLFRMIFQIRKNKYHYIVNVHRFASSGIITAFSGAPVKLGFAKNPLSFLFTKKFIHPIGSTHEVIRNQTLIEELTDRELTKPRLYPSAQHYESVSQYKKGSYICLAPTSVWFTKQLPSEKWIDLLVSLKGRFKNYYLLGAPNDQATCESIRQATADEHVINLSGKLSFLESAALMKDAEMNFVNDSAPLHIASAMNAPVTSVFCSTVPAFGFTPLSDRSYIIETNEKLDCRPCGLHGFRQCPKGHFKCAYTIENTQLLQPLP